MSNNIQYRFEGFPEATVPPLGTEFAVSVADVAPLEHGDIEVTLQFEDTL